MLRYCFRLLMLNFLEELLYTLYLWVAEVILLAKMGFKYVELERERLALPEREL